MKKGVVIVNTARGAVMDEAALVVALEKGQVWSCGLDVFEEEPKVHSGLVGTPLSFPSVFAHLKHAGHRAYFFTCLMSLITPVRR